MPSRIDCFLEKYFGVRHQEAIRPMGKLQQNFL